MLGFNIEKFTFEQKGDKPKSDFYSHAHWADFLPDQSDGLNFIYIICNETKLVTVGFEERIVLLVAPMEWSMQGTSDIVNYSPPNHLRKLLLGFHHQLMMSIKNSFHLILARFCLMLKKWRNGY